MWYEMGLIVTCETGRRVREGVSLRRCLEGDVLVCLTHNVPLVSRTASLSLDESHLWRVFRRVVECR